MSKENQKSMSCRKVVMRHFPIIVSDGTVNGRKEIRRSRIKSGMTPNLMGFTLIELLVVVLIIGILAAVALPQYQKAVWKSRYANLKNKVQALQEAQRIYYLANGEYATDMETLSVDLTGCTLSRHKIQCVYSWGLCRIDGPQARVFCEDTQTLKNAYVGYLSDTKAERFGVKSCWAYSTNRTDEYNKLCQREGGTYVTSGECSDSAIAIGGCKIYKLPS